MALAQILKQLDFMLPVEHIRLQLYLIGTHRVNLDHKFGNILVKKGGGSEKLEQYLCKHYESMESQLIQHLISSGRDLEWVMEQLKLGKQIPALKPRLSELYVMLGSGNSDSGFLSMASPSDNSQRPMT